MVNSSSNKLEVELDVELETQPIDRDPDLDLGSWILGPGTWISDLTAWVVHLTPCILDLTSYLNLQAARTCKLKGKPTEIEPGACGRALTTSNQLAIFRSCAPVQEGGGQNTISRLVYTLVAE